ncbi:MAG: cell wall hydrolase [Rhodomicrobiaceae bacterium]
MIARFEGRSRQIVYGAAAVSLAGAAFSLYHFTYLGAGTSGLFDGPGTSISRAPPRQASPLHLHASVDTMFTTSGKQDRADFATSQAVSALGDGANKATDARPASDGGQMQFVAASLTPIDMGRPGPTRNAELFGQAVNRDSKGDRLEAAASFGKTSPTRLAGIDDEAAPMTEGISAALFLLSSPAGIGEAASNVQQAGFSGASVTGADAEARKKSGWGDLIKMARVTGGDGEQIKSGIFGALSEDEFRAREFRCMATAVYFEARGESTQGQIAVGQVIMTRVRSDYYPNTICGVVYQGQWNRNACQFSFACDGKPDTPRDKKQWEVSLDVARKVIAGQAYVKEVGDATHYHATYVSPKWRKMMNRVARIGVHIFYKADFVRPLVAITDLDQL